jgi:hypothetical protein
MKNMLLKLFSVTILCSWFFGFGHVLHMGTIHDTHCIGDDASHVVCKTFIDIQAEQKIVKTLIMLVVMIITVFLIKIVFIKDHLGYVLKKYIPPPLQELFSSGILNPKAP